MVVPRQFAFDFCDLHVLIVDLADHLRRPVITNLVKALLNVNFHYQCSRRFLLGFCSGDAAVDGVGVGRAVWNASSYDTLVMSNPSAMFPKWSISASTWLMNCFGADGSPCRVSRVMG